MNRYVRPISLRPTRDEFAISSRVLGTLHWRHAAYNDAATTPSIDRPRIRFLFTAFRYTIAAVSRPFRGSPIPLAIRSKSLRSNDRWPELHSGHLVTSSASSIFFVGMISLSNEHVGSNQRQRGGPGGPYGREGLADRSEDLDHPAQRSVPFVPHVGASRGGELGSDEDRPVVGDVLDHAEPPHAPSGSAAGNASLLFNESGIYL